MMKAKEGMQAAQAAQYINVCMHVMMRGHWEYIQSDSEVHMLKI